MSWVTEVVAVSKAQRSWKPESREGSQSWHDWQQPNYFVLSEDSAGADWHFRTGGFIEFAFIQREKKSFVILMVLGADGSRQRHLLSHQNLFECPTQTFAKPISAFCFVPWKFGWKVRPMISLRERKYTRFSYIMVLLWEFDMDDMQTPRAMPQTLLSASLLRTIAPIVGLL